MLIPVVITVGALAECWDPCGDALPLPLSIDGDRKSPGYVGYPELSRYSTVGRQVSVKMLLLFGIMNTRAFYQSLFAALEKFIF